LHTTNSRADTNEPDNNSSQETFGLGLPILFRLLQFQVKIFMKRLFMKNIIPHNKVLPEARAGAKVKRGSMNHAICWRQIPDAKV
jgi:hypothetical protein